MNQSELDYMINSICNKLGSVVQYGIKTNLENCTIDAQNTPDKEDNTMASTVPSVYSRRRVIVGYNEGKPVYKFIRWSTQDEQDVAVVKAFIESGRIFDYLPENYLKPITASDTNKPLVVKHNFFEYIWEWYHLYKEPNIGTKYKATLIGRINGLCKYFGGYNIEDIKAQDIQAFLNSRPDTTAGTMKYYRNVLSQLFESALEDEIVFKNPAKSKRLSITGIESRGNKSLSLDECRRVLSIIPTLEDKRETLAVALMMLAGLRREEMLGLMWEDIDFEKKVLHVNRAIIIDNDGRSEIKVPKNKSSKRIVPMSDLLIDIIHPLRKSSGFIVTDTDGKLFIDRRYKTFWDTTKKHIGLPNLRAPELRHTYATMSAASGVDMKTVGANMGHTKISTTAEIYTQFEPVHAMNVRNQMTDYVQGIK